MGASTMKSASITTSARPAAELSGAEPGSEDWVAAMHKSWEVARCDAGTCALLANVSDTFAPDGSAAAPPDKGYSAQVAAQLREHFSPSLFQAAALRARGVVDTVVGLSWDLPNPTIRAPPPSSSSSTASGDERLGRIDGVPHGRRNATGEVVRGRVDGVRRARRRRPPRKGEETAGPTRP